MTEINPPARRRIRPVVTAENKPTGPVTARPRIRAKTLPVDHEQNVEVSPLARVRPQMAPADNPWIVPAGGRPLGVLQRTHNGYTPRSGELPDSRFKPLLIVMDPEWRTRLPGYIRERFEIALKWTPESCAKEWLPRAGSAYIIEWALRHNLGLKALSDDVYDALRGRLLAGWSESDPKDMIPAPQRSILQPTEDGDLLVDLTKASGPFYCDSALGIEHHFRSKMTPLQRVA